MIFGIFLLIIMIAVICFVSVSLGMTIERTRVSALVTRARKCHIIDVHELGKLTSDRMTRQKAINMLRRIEADPSKPQDVLYDAA